MVIRTWAEYLTPSEAVEKKTLDLLKRYGVILGMAFPPGSMNEEFGNMLKSYEDAGVEIMLWPLLEDHLGYWPNERNAKEFAEYVEKICGWADSLKTRFSWLAIDAELPHYQVEKIRGGKNPLGIASKLIETYTENRDRGRFYDASYIFNGTVGKLHERGVRVLSAAGETVAYDIKAGTIGFQDAMETPISTVNFDVFSFMVYTSMISGYSGGLIKTAEATRHLYDLMSDMKNVLWQRAGVSIGVTYIGKLIDEPYYKTPAELLPDMQAAKAALIDDISIYNLEGILRSPRPEEWFDTLISAEPKVPKKNLKSELIHNMLNVAARLL